jgi:hypothetical protein
LYTPDPRTLEITITITLDKPSVLFKFCEFDIYNI